MLAKLTGYVELVGLIICAYYVTRYNTVFLKCALIYLALNIGVVLYVTCDLFKFNLNLFTTRKVRADEDEDHKQEQEALKLGRQKLKEIMDAMKSDYITSFCTRLSKGVDDLEKLKEIMDAMKSDYITSFCTRLSKGVDDLENSTQEKLKTEKDPAKRHEIYTWATKAYARMSKFIQEIIDNIPPPTPAPFTDDQYD
ncbi:unnamed protein product [Oppiella nova]|uniref:Uncharacterized protein n=1 Tax=Oppiella nova TaxID=334625 RepID=A0A7R9QNL4_9ACAR|nr:unnamed protein product [Oppiella nova]CAG2169237.1 unnamed protein product [Oppiella nova]